MGDNDRVKNASDCWGKNSATITTALKKYESIMMVVVLGVDNDVELVISCTMSSRGVA